MRSPELHSIHFLTGAIVAFASVAFLFTEITAAQTETPGKDPSLTAWFGVWTITDDHPSAATDSNQRNTVEIRPTSDRKGLNITRKNPSQPDVFDVVIPDGTKKPLNAQNCTGWKTYQWLPAAGSIVGFSETTCKDSGTFATSTLMMFVDNDQMVEVLSVKSAGRAGVAVRHLRYEQYLAPVPDSQPPWVAVEQRISLAAPWTFEAIIQLSKSVEAAMLEAAMIEKKVRLNLTAGSLKQMQAAKVPKEIIDLTVALTFPDQFHIEKNGQVVLRPWIVSSPSGSAPHRLTQGVLTYYPGAFYDCNSPLGYYRGFSYSGVPGSCWNFYSPFWWDYPLYIPVGGGANDRSGNVVSSPVTATTGGYVQVQPVNTPRHAIPRQDWGRINSQGQQVSSGTYSTPGYSGSTAGSSGGGPAPSSSGGGGASAPTASPGGYSSGSSGGGTAVPKN
jgi:hypothetical protein